MPKFGFVLFGFIWLLVHMEHDTVKEHQHKQITSVSTINLFLISNRHTYFVTGWLFAPGYWISSTNKDCNNITDIILKVAIEANMLPPTFSSFRKDTT